MTGLNYQLETMTLNSKPMDVAALPDDVFLIIISHFEAWDLVRCRRVSRPWKEAFSLPDHLRHALKSYPLAREVQALSASGALNKSADSTDVEWATVFDRIASRYYHLTHGTSHRVVRYKLSTPEHIRLAHWHPVSPWDHHESQPGGRLLHQSPLNPWTNHASRPGERIHLFRHSFWSYDDGLLVYSPPRQSEYRWDSRRSMTVPVHLALVIRDLETDEISLVPFDLTKRVVRNFRLKDRTLIIEWAEEASFHALNDLERVHRHFASCYDIRNDTTNPSTPKWTVVLRNEFKLHFLGLPLNSRDRFFSVHNDNHYAIYFWQPNRSMYTGDEERPIESLFVWDISQPCDYLPSCDPPGKSKPPPTEAGPKAVARFGFRELDHLGIRQHSAIKLMCFQLNSAASTISVRENVCVAGQGYFDPAERLWCARTTTFPFVGEGPHLRVEMDGRLPPYRGNGSMDTTDVQEPEQWFLGIMDVVDDVADVRHSLIETVFTGQIMENKKMIRMEALNREPVVLDDALAREVSHMGRIAGDERFLVGQNASQEVVVLKF